MNGIPRYPEAKNEPVDGYAPQSASRAHLKAALESMSKALTEIPIVTGRKHHTGKTIEVRMPHDHRHVLAHAHQATPALLEEAITTAMQARQDWCATSFEARAAIFLKAADLLCGPFRDRMNAATMLGQSKTAHQSEIDAVCELADFWRFNVAFADQLMREQPISPPGTWNKVELRPLDGFVFAVTPFNFTSIGGNLPTAPAIMGNTAIWKPAQTQLLSAHVIMEVLEAAGLPPGVISMVSGDSAMISEAVLASPHLAGLHFTGSTAVFNQLWGKIGHHIDRYHQYPRIVGETGGKDFIFAHPSAHVAALATAIVRGGFEYQGQKCSAASRVYVPRSLWPSLKEQLVEQLSQVKVGDIRDFTHFMGAVIDERAFKKISSYVDLANHDAECSVVSGGSYHREVGWFIQPTLVEVRNPKHRLMQEEIFGPIVTLWVYEDAQLEEALTLCDTTSPYALTGAVFAQDRYAVETMSKRLRFAAGNFYINDKPTGAVVGQQPFGGARGSGTNDKAGSPANLMRWTSTRAMKENFVPPTHFGYPFMNEP